MSQESLLTLGVLVVILVLQITQFMRRSSGDPALAQSVAGLDAELRRQSAQIAAFQGEMKADLIRQSAEASERMACFTIEQTRALSTALADQRKCLENQNERAAAQERSVIDRLAKDAGETRSKLEEQRTAMANDLAVIRSDLNRAMAELTAGSVEWHRKLSETILQQLQQARDLIERKADEQRTLIDAKLKEMRESNEARLDAIRKTVDEQLQSAVEKQMNESFSRVIDQFTAVQKAMGDVQAVTAQIGDIKRLFSNVKARGTWGETQVRTLLDDILPPGSYETNCKLREESAEMVEFAVIMPLHGGERVYLPVDAKFPIEDFDRLQIAWEAGDTEAERAARRALETRVRQEAAKIAEKYINPPITVEFAVLYLPTEGLYAEVARIPGLIDDIGRQHRVVILGPCLLPAMLRTIQLGHVTLQLSRNADTVRELLGATKGEMQKMETVLGQLAKQVGTVGNTIHKAQVRTRAVTRKLRNIEAVDVAKAAQMLELEAPELDEIDEETVAL